MSFFSLLAMLSLSLSPDFFFVSALTSPQFPFVFACGYEAKLIFAGSESGGSSVGIFVVRDKAFILFLFFFFHKPIFVSQVKSSSSSTKKRHKIEKQTHLLLLLLLSQSHFCFTLKKKKTKPNKIKDRKNLSKKTQNLFHGIIWMFCGYFIMKWRIVIIVWLMRK